ncbi:MAG: preprotein translocase subunit YajC [Pseudomonadota bacterium]
MFISPAYAQAGAPAGGGDFLISLVPILLMLVIFYFLVLRPQQNRMKQHQEMVANAKRGDTVVTAGGLVGKVTRAKEGEAEIEVEISENTRVKVVRGTLADVRNKSDAAAAKS